MVDVSFRPLNFMHASSVEELKGMLQRQFQLLEDALSGLVNLEQLRVTDVKTSDYIAKSNELVLVDPGGGTVGVRLPPAKDGGQVIVKDINTTSPTINITAQDGDTTKGTVTITTSGGSLFYFSYPPLRTWYRVSG